MSKHRLESLTRSSYNVCCHSRPRVTLPHNGSVSGDPSDQGIQDILKLCHLNVISMHWMLLLKKILLYKKALCSIWAHAAHIFTCDMYNVYKCLVSFPGHYNVYVYIHIYIYTYILMGFAKPAMLPGTRS